jgi:hypothetical protein
LSWRKNAAVLVSPGDTQLFIYTASQTLGWLPHKIMYKI